MRAYVPRGVVALLYTVILLLAVEVSIWVGTGCLSMTRARRSLGYSDRFVWMVLVIRIIVTERHFKASFRLFIAGIYRCEVGSESCLCK